MKTFCEASDSRASSLQGIKMWQCCCMEKDAFQDHFAQTKNHVSYSVKFKVICHANAHDQCSF